LCGDHRTGVAAEDELLGHAVLVAYGKRGGECLQQVQGEVLVTGQKLRGRCGEGGHVVVLFV
jgi:hypothetical protein